ncbi:uncharacterized protein B0H18DRAFT_451601 [Fomitopsis serialis]|uniref:uncharacterized protein n=1 Tax=Fomitopsis serialis TaxID=139415 RepID=UPI0020072BE1|nr:uncharacterized protein B0H18DRAFT_451601 [Neoantrodia serialis]KAH9923889.1 hypothetical protein B0H18DRAFT_451601 [Neoantrodia serialis]
MSAAEQKVWLITGTSSGLGKSLVASALGRGDLVIATVRRREDFSLSDADASRVHVLLLDVTVPEDSVRQKIAEAWNVWGRIDVLVNNAGYVSQCLLEEGGLSAAMKQFDVNFFGVLKVTNAILPHMRARKSGLVVFVGSRAVWQANIPTAGLYIASKAAIHTYSETLAAEVGQFGIRVLLAVPGGFRTTQDKQLYTQNVPLEEYNEFRDNILNFLANYWSRAQGDPAKAMEVLTDVVRGEGKAKDLELPPLLLLGDATYTQARVYSETLLENASKWEGIGKNLNFDPSI